MLGLMQDWPLLCHRIIDHAAINHGDRPVITRSIEGPIHQHQLRAKSAPARCGSRSGSIVTASRLGDRVATLAWNTWRHLESWYGILGIGAIYHTVNPRLFPEQIVWIINHAEDRVMMTDLTFVPLLEKIADKLPIDRAGNRLHRRSAYAGDDVAERGRLRGLAQRSRRRFRLEGVRREYRGRHVLHVGHDRQSEGRALFASLERSAHHDVAADRGVRPFLARRHDADRADVSCQQLGTGVLGARWSGSALVLPGAKLDGASVYELLNDYKVTCTGAVPTVWLLLLQYLEKTGGKLPYLNRVIIGGSACPRAMIKTFEEDYGVHVFHAWGMTEMSPLGTVGSLKPEYADLPLDGAARHQTEAGPHAVRRRDGRSPTIRGRKLPWDGRTFGRIKVTGPCRRPGLLQRRYADPRQRRLFRHRRRRHDRPARLHADHRPVQGRDQIRRRVDFLDRSGEPCGRLSESRRSRRDRRTASEMGRTAAAGDRAQGGPDRHQGGNSRLPRGQDRQLVDAGRCGFRHRRFRTRRPARSRRPRCAISSKITCCRQRSLPSKIDLPESDTNGAGQLSRGAAFAGHAEAFSAHFPIIGVINQALGQARENRARGLELWLMTRRIISTISSHQSRRLQLEGAGSPFPLTA